MTFRLGARALLATIVALGVGSVAHAQSGAKSGSGGGGSGGGGGKVSDRISLGFGGGGGSAIIENPDTTKAHYATLALRGEGQLRFAGGRGRAFEVNLIGVLNYYNLTNSYSYAGEKEVGYFLGPGAGLALRIKRVVVGATYDYMMARHYTTGPLSYVLTYQMPVTTAFAGINIPLFWNFSAQVRASMSTGTISKGQTGLSKDSPYQDVLYWVVLKYK
jgi:hypothetical protein